jgi:hypothetical protein
VRASLLAQQMPEEHPILGQKSYRAIYRLGCLQFTHTRNASMGRARPSPQTAALQTRVVWAKYNWLDRCCGSVVGCCSALPYWAFARPSECRPSTLHVRFLDRPSTGGDCEQRQLPLSTNRHRQNGMGRSSISETVPASCIRGINRHKRRSQVKTYSNDSPRDLSGGVDSNRREPSNVK